jgi:glutamate dehydrogenase (NAD(P)+)
VRRAQPATTLITYVDPDAGFHGYLAYCGDRHRLAAGGLRVQAGIDAETVAALAGAMFLKERLLGLAVDGAKAGIDLDPSSPTKHAALGRFLRFLRPHLVERLSLGPDVGTQWDELEAVARQVDVASVKMAVARAQGFDAQQLRHRLDVLDEVVDGRTVGQRRAGHALAHAALAASAAVGPTTGRPLRVAIQGFGTLGRAAGQSLVQAGATVVAVADAEGCLLGDDGLDMAGLLSTPHCSSIVGCPPSRAVTAPCQAVFEQPVDVLVLAACEDALSLSQAGVLEARTVAVGANLGLSPESEDVLHRRGVLVIPDFVAGCGGSASMDALFGPADPPSGRSVLDQVGRRMTELVAEIVGLARDRGVTTRQAALDLCASRPDSTGARPYGRWTPSASSRVPVASGDHR